MMGCMFLVILPNNIRDIDSIGTIVFNCIGLHNFTFIMYLQQRTDLIMIRFYERTIFVV